MPTPLGHQNIDKLGVYGVIRPLEVDDSLIPDGAVVEAVNFHFDRKGAATVRLGLTGLGSTVLTSRPCVGLYNAQGGTAISVFSNGSSATIYSYNGTAWSMSLDGGTASVKIRFVDFGSYTIALNFIYNTYSSMRFWNAGSSRHWHNTGNPINPQNMWGYNPQFGDVFKSKVYLGGDPGYKSRLWFSSVITSTGNITWSPSVDYVDINPGDGEDGTAIKRYSLELLYFKPNYIYRFRTSGVDPDPLINIGTRSHESVIEGKLGLYFHHDTGFYRYSGGYPKEISRQIIDFIQAIPFSQYDEITGWKDDDHLYWSVGNLSVAETRETKTWRNVVLRYTESSEVWTVYSYASDIRRAIIYTTGSALSQIAGLDNGVVATINSGNTDLGEAIEYRLRTKWYSWEGITNRKVITKLAGVCEKSLGTTVKYRVDEKTQWETIGQLKNLITFFENQSIRFHRIQFQVDGESRGEPAVFQSLEILEGVNESLVKET